MAYRSTCKTYEPSEATVFYTEKLSAEGMTRAIRVQGDRLELALERDGAPAGGTFLRRADVAPLAEAVRRADARKPVIGLVGSIPARNGARYDVAVTAGFDKQGAHGAVTLQLVLPGEHPKRPSVFARDALRGLRRALDHLGAHRSFL